jgi:hypothetical protein
MKLLKVNKMKTNKSKEKLYKTLKPLVDDYSKPCRRCKKHPPGDDICIKFLEEEKEFNIENWITKNFKPELLCKICKSLFKNPYTCYKCNTPFCYLCIKLRLGSHSKCPNCFEMIFLEMLQPSTHDYLKIYNENYKCPFDGCLAHITLADLKEHMAECIFKHKQQGGGYCDKLIHADVASDPCMKTYLYDYMLGLTFNKPVGISKIDLTSNVNTVQAVKYKQELTTLSDKYAKTILELQEASKKTNEKLKNMKTQINI